MLLLDQHLRDLAIPTSVRFLFYELVARRIIAKSGERPDKIVTLVEHPESASEHGNGAARHADGNGREPKLDSRACPRARACKNNEPSALQAIDIGQGLPVLGRVNQRRHGSKPYA
jgi:hypothetical protein